MTLIDEVIRSTLLSDSTVSGMVGTRIYPLQLPLTCTFPALSYLFPSDPFKLVLRSARCQIDCWAEDFTECKNLKQAVETALKFYTGTVNGLTIENIYPLDTQDQPLDESGIFHIVYDFRVSYYTH